MVPTRWLFSVSRRSFPRIRPPRTGLRNTLIIASAAGLIAAASGAIVTSGEKGQSPDLVVGQALAVTTPPESAAALPEVLATFSTDKAAVVPVPELRPSVPDLPAASDVVPVPQVVAAPEKLAAITPPPQSVGEPAPAPSAEPLTLPQEPIAGSVPARETWQAAAVAPQPEGAVLPTPPVQRPATHERIHVAAVQHQAPSEKHVAKPHVAPPPAPAKPAEASFSSLVLGKWVPNRDACANPDASEYLPLMIGRSRATAGEGSCEFLSKKHDGRGWSVVAECSDGENAWTSNVSLAVAAGELTWTSDRGTQSYVRCAPTVVAKAAAKQRVAAHRSTKKTRVVARKPKASTVRVTGGQGGSGKPGWAVLHVN